MRNWLSQLKNKTKRKGALKAPFFYFYLMRYKLSVFFFFSFLISANAQHFDYNQNCKEIHESVLRLEFNRANQLILHEKSDNPGNLLPVYFENYIDFLRLVIGENEDSLQLLEGKKEYRIDRLRQGPESDPYYRYCEANINMQWAFARIKFEEYLQAFFEIRRALKLLEENQEMFPVFLPQYTGLGLLHTLLGSIPEDYQWISDLLGLKGDMEQGLDEMRMLIELSAEEGAYKVFAKESLFFYSLLQTNMMMEEKQMMGLEEIMDTLKPDSPLIIFARAGYYQKTGQNEKALVTLSGKDSLNNSYPFHYLDYMEGLSLIYKLDSNCRKPLRAYRRNFQGENYLASACQKIAWSYLLEGDTLAYLYEIKKSLKMPESVVGADEEARNEAMSGEIPDVQLLKSRLLFDGGYYPEALEVLSNIDNRQVKDQAEIAEFYYRKGRIYQAMGRYRDALKNLQMSINLGEGLKRYFAAYAALQSAMIYEKLGEKENAARYYQLCLDMDFEEYERSIKYKARMRLNKLK